MQGDETDEFSKEPLDIFVGQSARFYIRKYYDMILLPKDRPPLAPGGSPLNGKKGSGV